MVKIISEGKTIAICDEPRYIRVKEETGVYVKAAQGDAQGIAVLGESYNLPGHTEITRTVVKDEETGELENVTAPEAYAVEVDGGEVAFANEQKAAETEETALAGLMATTDLYEELVNKGVLD